VWEFDERKRSDGLFYFVVRPPFFGTIEHAHFMHAHHDWVDHFRVYDASPQDLGLFELDPGESTWVRGEAMHLSFSFFVSAQPW
jgi:hypothetical protein